MLIWSQKNYFISDCRTPTEKASELLDFYFKLLVQESWSNVQYSRNFIYKTKIFKTIPNDTNLVAPDAVVLHPTIHFSS